MGRLLLPICHHDFTKTHIEIRNQHPQSASQQLLSVSLASGISASDSVLHCRLVLHQNSRIDSNFSFLFYRPNLDDPTDIDWSHYLQETGDSPIGKSWAAQ
jgi:hypothetical protein